jgi:hypothetical protein
MFSFKNMFKFESVYIRNLFKLEICSNLEIYLNSKICINLKSVQFEICSNSNLFNLKFVQN